MEKYFGAEELLKTLRIWADDGDRAVGCALVLGFAAFGEGNEDCLFPDGRDLSVSVGEVEEPAEVLQAEKSKVTDM